MLSENIVACLLPGTSFGGCLVSRSRFSAEILPGFFAERWKRLALACLSSVLISSGAGWKVVLFLMCINGAVALALRTLLKLDMSPLASIHSVILIIEFAHHLYCLLPEQRRLHIIRGSARCTETVPH